MFSGKNILRKEKHFLLFDSIVEITLENYFMCLVLHRKKPISRKCKHKPATTTKHNPPPTTQNPDWEEKKKKTHHHCSIATKIHQNTTTRTTTTTTKSKIKEKENQTEKSGRFGSG